MMNSIHNIPPSSPTEALDQLLELVVLLNDDATRSLAREGLTLSRASLVWVLYHKGPRTQRELAASLKVIPRNVTGLVDGLGHVLSELRAALQAAREEGR